MPHPGRMTPQKAKDFKGTMRSLLAELGHYKFRLIAVIVFAVLSTIFNIAGPKVLAKATTALATGWWPNCGAPAALTLAISAKSC